MLNGYQVVFVPFADGKTERKGDPFVQGFIGADGSVYGRPVGVAFDSKGALIIADDVGNAVWRVSANKAAGISGAATNFDYAAITSITVALLEDVPKFRRATMIRRSSDADRFAQSRPRMAGF